MLHKEIKTKAQAAKVAKELAEDLKSVMSIYDGYDIYTISGGSDYTVKLSSEDSQCCLILTSSAIGTALEVVNFYSVKYKYISYLIGVAGTKDERFKPVMEININFKNQ